VVLLKLVVIINTPNILTGFKIQISIRKPFTASMNEGFLYFTHAVNFGILS